MEKHGNIEKCNARIRSTFLGIEDHGCFTFILDLDYGSSGQGFGCRCNIKVIHIRQVLEVLGVDSWERLPRKLCRAIFDHGEVYAIGHVINDKWLVPQNVSDWLITDEDEAWRLILEH